MGTPARELFPVHGPGLAATAISDNISGCEGEGVDASLEGMASAW